MYAMNFDKRLLYQDLHKDIIMFYRNINITHIRFTKNFVSLQYLTSEV